MRALLSSLDHRTQDQKVLPDPCNERDKPRRQDLPKALAHSFPRSTAASREGVNADAPVLGGQKEGRPGVEVGRSFCTPSQVITFVPAPSPETAEQQSPLRPKDPAAAALLRDRQRSGSAPLMAAPPRDRRPMSRASATLC